MGILKRMHKKIKGSSLTEVLTASVIIMIVFGITVTTLGTMIRSLVSKNTQFIENEINEIHYLIKQKQLKIPFQEEANDWIMIVEKENNSNVIIIEATNTVTMKKIYRKLISYDK